MSVRAVYNRTFDEAVADRRAGLVIIPVMCDSKAARAYSWRART